MSAWAEGPNSKTTSMPPISERMSLLTEIQSARIVVSSRARGVPLQCAWRWFLSEALAVLHGGDPVSAIHLSFMFVARQVMRDRANFRLKIDHSDRVRPSQMSSAAVRKTGNHPRGQVQPTVFPDGVPRSNARST